ncbi:hypothetical protein [Synechococcus sp. MIT S1220]|uniref:hypothetical protein n=1 Tax=Synechococcus sp. MIT S1220 TaxID=3082549 RepID=UPI0039B04E3B
MSNTVFSQSLKGIWQDVMSEDGLGAQQAISIFRTKYSSADVKDWEASLPRKRFLFVIDSLLMCHPLLVFEGLFPYPPFGGCVVGWNDAQ